MERGRWDSAWQRPHRAGELPGDAQRLVPRKCHRLSPDSSWQTQLSTLPPLPAACQRLKGERSHALPPPSTQHCQQAHPHPARPGLQEAAKLFLMSWHSAWLSLEGKQPVACGARMLRKGKNHRPTWTAGRSSFPSTGSACAYLGSALGCPPVSQLLPHSGSLEASVSLPPSQKATEQERGRRS